MLLTLRRRRVLLRGAIALVAAVGCGCTPKPPGAGTPVRARLATAPTADGWPGVSYDSVVGYLFQIPSPEGGSVVREHGVDEETLKQTTLRSVDLTEHQVTKLLSGTFSKTAERQPHACYDPHHIFIFHNSGDTIVAAIEVCFECDGIQFFPEKEGAFRHHDFSELAILCDSLGLGLGPNAGDLQEYLSFRKEQTESRGPPLQIPPAR